MSVTKFLFSTSGAVRKQDKPLLKSSLSNLLICILRHCGAEQEPNAALTILAGMRYTPAHPTGPPVVDAERHADCGVISSVLTKRSVPTTSVQLFMDSWPAPRSAEFSHFDSPISGLPIADAPAGCSVTAVKSSFRMYSSAALSACVAASVLTLGSGTATAAGSCPTAAPPGGGAPDWTLAGTTGSVAVIGSTDTTAPSVTVTTPFSVAQTQVHTLRGGNGPAVPGTARVSVCYMGVNGRDGSVFDSSYDRGAPVDFALNGVVPGFQKAIAGQNVGSTVAVAMIPADGYPNGQPSAGIRPGDTLVFAIKILNASG